MNKTAIHGAFDKIKLVFPKSLHRFVRRWVTAFLTPVRFSSSSGHFRSSIAEKAVDSSGEPIPWYTYPCIDFLRFRELGKKKVLEFGAGQSTQWWANRGAEVVAFEGDEAWFETLQNKLPRSVALHLADMSGRDACADSVIRLLGGQEKASFDVVVIDGLYREQMVPIALEFVSPDGIIVIDNSDGYEMYDLTSDSGLHRVDFYGYAPGVVLPHCTSVFFRPDCSWFDARLPIKRVALE